MSEGPLKIFLVAGEASGDRLGGALIRGMRDELAGGDGPETGRELELMGVGGAAMAAQGLTSLFPVQDIAVMGYTEILPKLPVLMRRLNEATRAAIAFQPDLLITIDAPDFGLRIADRLRAHQTEAADLGPRAGAPSVCVHYVAPSVWAWRPKRAERLAARVDHLLALLPFEPPYFERVGLSCDFVGHPVVESGAVEAGRADAAALRAELGLAADAPVVVALPGSRMSEIRRLAPVFGDALAQLADRRPGLQVVVPLAEGVADAAAAAVASWGAPATTLDPRGLSFETAERRKFRAMAAADVALAASGTVSLELAAARTPMVIAYRLSAITAMVARRLRLIDTATLVNLVTDSRAVPEFFQENCRADLLCEELDALLEPRNKNRAAQIAAAAETLDRLGAEADSPARRAARSALAALARRRASGRGDAAVEGAAAGAAEAAPR